MSVVPLVRTFPVMEIFGPVVQGEGPVAGQVTHFVRFGLCDYRCSWCDSMFAVEPKEVKLHGRRLSNLEIELELSTLPRAPWVTFSGGNPALHDLETLVSDIQNAGVNVCVETQGSKWRDWLSMVAMLVVSPKPPSSGMATDEHREETDRFMAEADRSQPLNRRAIKIVVFDEDDLTWADAFMIEYPWPHLYLSVGTDPPHEHETLLETRDRVCDRYRWLCERVPYLASRVTVLPQLHVLAYGHQRGV